MRKNIFNTVKLTKPGKSRFDLTHDVKLSTTWGDLTPVCVMETVPGDVFRIGAESLVRLMPMTSPVMHRMDVSIHYFFVPNRILWPNWEKFITDPASGKIPPQLTWNSNRADLSQGLGKLGSYMGLPVKQPGDLSNWSHQVSALPFAAYQKIYNEYYRDQNLVPEVPWELRDGTQLDETSLLAIRKRAWEHDYFTSALPWAQKNAGVDIPLGDVTLKPNNNSVPQWVTTSAPNLPVVSGGQLSATNTDGFTQVSGTDLVKYDPADTLQVESTSINDLRRAFRLQEFLERLAIGGSRTKEVIRAMFGVNSSDARLQRPEYITGVKTPIVVSEVLNTTGEDGGLPQGNQAGHGIAVVQSGKKGYYCEEHGYIIGIMSIMPKTAYQDGIPRHYLRNDSLEYYWPQFANLGEQPIEQRELYVKSASPEATFGYQSRYAEYKYVNNRVAGQLATTLKSWHIGRIFDNDPALNKDFIECNPRKDIFAVVDQEEDPFVCHVLNKIDAIRPMPYFGTPTI